MVRTTVTLDPDVQSLIEKTMREQNLTFRQAINQAIRAGLGAPAGEPFKQRVFAMGFRPEINYDRALHIAAALEDEEIARKLAHRD